MYSWLIFFLEVSRLPNKQRELEGVRERETIEWGYRLLWLVRIQHIPFCICFLNTKNHFNKRICFREGELLEKLHWNASQNEVPFGPCWFLESETEGFIFLFFYFFFRGGSGEMVFYLYSASGESCVRLFRWGL